MIEVSGTRVRGWLRDLAIVLVIFFGVRAYQQRGLPSGPAPEVRGVDLSGVERALTDYRGKPVLVHFWASWCGVCVAAQPNIDAVGRDHPVLTIASRSGSADEVAAYAREHAIEVPVLLDPGDQLVQAFGVRAFPTSFVLDGQGRIRHVEVGYTTTLGLRARMWAARVF